MEAGDKASLCSLLQTLGGGGAGEVDLRHSSHRENKGRKVLPAVP